MRTKRNWALAILATLCVLSKITVCLADDPSEHFVISGPIYPLTTEQLGESDFSKDLYKKGTLDNAAIEKFLAANVHVSPKGNKDPDAEPSIIHMLQWSDASHTTVTFQKWYMYDPNLNKNGGYYALSDQQILEDTFVPGEKAFRLIFIHLSPAADLGQAASLTDSFTDNTYKILNHPISYTVDITKEDSQFKQDVQTLGKILGLVGAAPPAPPMYVGYWGWAEVESNYSTSSIKITPSSSSKTPVASSNQDQSSNKASATLSANTYSNEAPTYIGLSVAVPVTSYKDVTYQSGSTTLVPTTVSKQSAYANLDFYFPAALPGLMALRYIPHPFIGLPLQGKVLEHPMAGLAIGFPWMEV